MMHFITKKENGKLFYLQNNCTSHWELHASGQKHDFLAITGEQNSLTVSDSTSGSRLLEFWKSQLISSTVQLANRSQGCYAPLIRKISLVGCDWIGDCIFWTLTTVRTSNQNSAQRLYSLWNMPSLCSQLSLHHSSGNSFQWLISPFLCSQTAPVTQPRKFSSNQLSATIFSL